MPVQKKEIKKGSYLTQYGVINNAAYYIKSGIIHLSLGHEQGKKSLNMFGSGTIFRDFSNYSNSFADCVS